MHSGWVEDLELLLLGNTSECVLDTLMKWTHYKHSGCLTPYLNRTIQTLQNNILQRFQTGLSHLNILLHIHSHKKSTITTGKSVSDMCNIGLITRIHSWTFVFTFVHINEGVFEFQAVCPWQTAFLFTLREAALPGNEWELTCLNVRISSGFHAFRSKRRIPD
jgi:hypothetical protein